MKVKVLLKPASQKPRWVLLAKDLIHRNVPKSYNLRDEHSRINPFLQDWSPSGNNVAQNTLPISIHCMIKTMKIHNVAFNPINPSRGLAMNMPIWWHIRYKFEAKPSLRLNGPYEKCLRSVHKVKTVQDVLNVTGRLQFASHNARQDCTCAFCRDSSDPAVQANSQLALGPTNEGQVR